MMFTAYPLCQTVTAVTDVGDKVDALHSRLFETLKP